MKKLILSVLFYFIITIISTAASAVTVTINGTTLTGGTSVNISGTYGSFQISPLDASTTARVVALPGDTVNILALGGARIRNMGTITDTISITYSHQFSANTSVTRFYGTSMSGGFVNGLDELELASDDSISMTSKVGFKLFACEFECDTFAQIAPAPPQTYTVPATGSPGLNQFGPQNPQQGSANFLCSAVFGGEATCESLEILKADVVSITLKPGDSVGLPGSLNIVAANSAANRAQQLALLGVKIDIKPGSFPNEINPSSQGVIPVAILTTPTFDATTVNPLTVLFGPAGATEAHGRGHIEDVDGDGNLDMVLHFRTQETGIACGQNWATLNGQTIGGQPFSAFDSIRVLGCP